jgi:hypothetical protein
VIERRRLPRTRVAQPAKVLAEDADVGHDCTVENLNTLGACISFDAGTFAELPRKFDLTFDNCHTYWQCDVIWRDDRFDNRVLGPQIRVKKRSTGSTVRDNEGSGVTHCPLLRLSSLCTVTLRP